MNNDFRDYSAAFHYRNGEIMHFGILGMRWGVRRYQNKDGSLTAEGLRRYQYDSDKNRYKKRSREERKKFDEDLAEKQKYPNTFFSFRLDNPTDAQKLEQKARKLREKNRTENAEGYEELKKDGFKKSEYGDEVVKRDKDGNDIELRLDKNGSFKKSSEMYNEFKSNKKEHMEKMFNQCFEDFKKSNWSREWVDDEDMNALHRELKSSKCWFNFIPDSGTISVMTDSLEELGYHSFSFEYDPKTKKIIGSIGLEG